MPSKHSQHNQKHDRTCGESSGTTVLCCGHRGSHSSLEFTTSILTFPMSVIIFFAVCRFFPDKTGDRFLDGNGQYVISAQRSIRIFGKRFMESGMTSILVLGVGPGQKKVVFSKNRDFVNRKFNSKIYVFFGFRRI